MNYITKLNEYNRAGFPILQTVSHEEGRLVQEVIKAHEASVAGYVKVWDHVTGVTSYTNGQGVKSEGIKNPKELFVLIESLAARGTACIFILKDFHPFFENPSIVRHLRNLLNDCKAAGITLVLVSPVSKIPIELMRDVQLLEYALPGGESLQQIVQKIQKDTENNNNVVLPLVVPMGDIVDAMKGSTASEAENITALALSRHKGFDKAFVKTAFSETIQNLKKSSLLTYLEPDVDFTNIGGLDGLKKWFGQRAKAFEPAAREYGLPAPKGVLLFGVAGCGKTLIAKAVSKEFNIPLFQLDIGSLFGSLVGSTEENFRKIISTVDSLGRCIVFIDEIEKAFNRDAVSGRGDTGTSSRAFGSFLTWLSERQSQAFVIGTSNNFTILPVEFMRKGRFDELFWIDLPNFDERKSILSVVIKKFKRDPRDFEIPQVSKMMEGFSGAEISEVVSAALFTAYCDDGREPTTEDLKSAVVDTIPQSETNGADLKKMREQAAGKLRVATSEGRASSFEKAMRKLNLEE